MESVGRLRFFSILIRTDSQQTVHFMFRLRGGIAFAEFHRDLLWRVVLKKKKRQSDKKTGAWNPSFREAP